MTTMANTLMDKTAIQEKMLLVLDVDSRDKALQLVKSLHDVTGMFKVGLELYMACGATLVREIIDLGGRVFLDLKFHDIPNTVRHATVEAAKLGVSMMTIHAAGGREMMEAVSKDLQDKFGEQRPIVVGITVLTSLNAEMLKRVGVTRTVNEQVVELALLAQDSGIDGVVCSPQEIRAVRQAVGSGFKIVTPGIRMPGQALDDQQRTATPQEAIAAGADYLVIGRAVTKDKDPRGALERLIQSV